MLPSKPKDLEEYKLWLHKEHGQTVTRRTEQYYDSVLLHIQDCMRQSEFWTTLMRSLQEVSDRYQVANGILLFSGPSQPTIYRKSFVSTLQKSFRKNILDNRNWPEAPHDGWFLPETWFNRINDLVRTLLVVKYLDGVPFFTSEVTSIASKLGLRAKTYFEARQEGYYAAHMYVPIECEIPRLTFDTTTVIVQLELQVTTQLQELIRTLLHSHYEARRTATTISEVKWQWDYTKDEFEANYLGHILHYLEAAIVKVRNKQKGSL